MTWPATSVTSAAPSSENNNRYESETRSNRFHASLLPLRCRPKHWFSIEQTCTNVAQNIALALPLLVRVSRLCRTAHHRRTGTKRMWDEQEVQFGIIEDDHGEFRRVSSSHTGCKGVPAYVADCRRGGESVKAVSVDASPTQ